MSQDNPQLEAPDDPANEQPLVAHLIELRNRLMKSVIAIIVVFACLSPFTSPAFPIFLFPQLIVTNSFFSLIYFTHRADSCDTVWFADSAGSAANVFCMAPLLIISMPRG